MLSVFVALTPMDKANGTLEVLRGSNKCGRVDHDFVSGQNTPADAERLAEIEARHERVVCNLEAGDALFLHCLTLHMSGPNMTDAPRWSLVGCFNARGNNPYKEHHRECTACVCGCLARALVRA